MSDFPLPRRMRGRVFALNNEWRLGHVRLPDNTRVSFALEDFAAGTRALKLGDAVDFLIEATPEGPRAREMTLVAAETPAVAGSTPGSDDPPSQRRYQETRGRNRSIPHDFDKDLDQIDHEYEVGPVSGHHYQLAIVARAEGRVSEARRLFELAIAEESAQNAYAAYAKMEMEQGDSERASGLIERALQKHPSSAVLYVMKGQMERRAGRHREAEQVFRKGLDQAAGDVILRQSLARTLADIGTASSFKEANRLFEQLEREGKVNTGDGAYQRYRALKNSARASRAYAFFDQFPGFRVDIPGRRDLPTHVTDLVVQINNNEFEASFGLRGAYLIRCFDLQPPKTEILALLEQLRVQGSQQVGLSAGKAVPLSPSMAFVIVPGTGAVRDQFMSVLSENNEALIPLDDGNLVAAKATALEVLKQLLAQFLGSRDLYLSTLPVSGRKFYGRERLLVQVTDQIRRGEFVGIFGLRKMGKTSLVYQLRDQKLRDEAVAYIDLQASSALILKTFGPIYWEIERELLSHAISRWPDIAKLLRLAAFSRFSDVPHDESRVALIFAEDLREVLTAIAQGRSHGVRSVVIVLDELERILPINQQTSVHGYVEFFALLRGLAQTEAFRGLISSVVVAANALISERASWEGKENPVFALYQPVFLPPFSENDTAHMVDALGKAMSVYWNAATLSTIFYELGGHPFLTRQFCGKLIKANPKRPLVVTPNMVSSVIPHFVRDEADKFEQIVELLHTYFPSEEMALEKLALGSADLSVDDTSIRHLTGYQLVQFKQGVPVVTPNALKRWLRHRAGWQK